MSKLVKNPEHSPMYGVLRVKGVNGDRVEFMMSKVGYGKTSGPSKDIRAGKTTSNDYYYPETIMLSVTELKAMRHSGVVTSVRRN